ncbi:uncharacterized protein TNCV_1270501 [Trichonephila clavipes]|nr:uncharacterized protein TNCV_1270501 [Trichonephila clavipes]
MATSTNKTAAFGVKLIHKCMSKETPLHPETLSVWCALWVGGIIGPYFFKNDEGHNVTVNGDWYRAMITNFFIPELNNHNVQELWFQQDCATCHSARATIDLLKDTFGDRLISRFGPVNWPPRSCDLTPLDYFLWGYVKSLVYADKPQTFDHLEDNIRRVIADIRPQMLEKVIENWTSRLDYIRASRGNPMPEIIFKMKLGLGGKFHRSPGRVYPSRTYGPGKALISPSAGLEGVKLALSISATYDLNRPNDISCPTFLRNWCSRRCDKTNGLSCSSACCLYFGGHCPAAKCVLLHSTARRSLPRYARPKL